MKFKFKIIIISLLVDLLLIISAFILFYKKVITVNFGTNDTLLIISGITVIIIPLIVSILFSKQLSNTVKSLSDSLKQFLSTKDLSKVFSEEENRKDEFQNIFSELYNLQDTYLAYSKFSNDLAEGNYKSDIETGKEQPIGKSLLNIRDKIAEYENKIKKNIEELKRNNWYQKGVTDFTLLLQQDFKSTEESAYPIIKKLAEHLEIEQAGIFVLKKRGEKQILELEAAYAYDKKKQLDTEIEIGESLVGKCAKEQKMIRIDDLPEGYTFISSGLGEDTPKTLILMPLIYEKKLFGVLELASLKTVDDYKIDFINVIAERIAAEISNIKTKLLTAKLAEDYKKQSDELFLKEKQSEENLLKLTDELRILQKQKKKAEELFDIFNQTALIKMNTDGTIIFANNPAKEIYEIKDDETKVLNDEELKNITEKLMTEDTIKRKITRHNNIEFTEKYIAEKDSEGNLKIIILITI